MLTIFLWMQKADLQMGAGCSPDKQTNVPDRRILFPDTCCYIPRQATYFYLDIPSMFFSFFHSRSTGRHEHGTIRAKVALEALKVLQDQTRGLYILLTRASHFDT